MNSNFSCQGGDPGTCTEKTQIQGIACLEKKKQGHVGLHGSRCERADFKIRYALFGLARFFGALKHPEKHQNWTLCSEFMSTS